MSKTYVWTVVGVVSLTMMIFYAIGYTTSEVVGLEAGILAGAAYVRYIVKILEGKTVPSPTTWVILAVLGLLMHDTFSEVGAGAAVWLAKVNILMPIIIAGLSLKFGKTKWEPTDWICGIGAIVMGILWWIFHMNPLMALLAVIVLDGIAMGPTVEHSYEAPEEEDPLAWTLSSTAALVNLYAVEVWSWQTLAYGYYMLVACSLIVLLTVPSLRHRIRIPVTRLRIQYPFIRRRIPKLRKIQIRKRK